MGVSLLNEDLLHNILTRLPALSFASATCVSKTWNSVSNRILSRPKLSSALSLNPSPNDAVNEVLHKILSEPIRPHFAIVNLAVGFGASKILWLVTKTLGSDIPVIVSVTNGIMGRDALTGEFKEVKWDADALISAIVDEGIVLTVGYLPGLKVEAIPLQRPAKVELGEPGNHATHTCVFYFLWFDVTLSSTSLVLIAVEGGRCDDDAVSCAVRGEGHKKTPQEPWIDNFVMDIKEYSASVSSCQFPVGIMLFGEATSDMELLLKKLDYAMPMDTFIVGNERGSVVYRSGNDYRSICDNTKDIEAVALVFAQDKDRSSGSIRFHIAFSNGVSTVGARYKADSVQTNFDVCSTRLMARREGQQELLDGQSILLELKNSMENHIQRPEFLIRVIKHRKFSIGAEKPMPRKSIAYHGVLGVDEEYLYVDGIGIKKGDIFQFYHSDPNAALVSLTVVHDVLNNIKMGKNSRRFMGDGDNSINVFGGFIFACYGRGESFFGRHDVDSSPFLENFPGVPLGGIFCCGEIVRPCTPLIGQHQGAGPISFCLHTYGTVYLVMSYAPPSVEQ
ncbi:F-box/LRR-repeat protein At5g63520-like isoform X2 [Lotus japonicus]|uniref:F-box/LRR-repeat protein At5g63520-like isoform X2 n=1 Tax=Lotus japonicus TaxID=34305 RepID=UPI00258EAFEB|nr:F-box/LRR-repeat protein At5g63520-like isoform X2 [Lotus japonicus]